MATLQSLQRLTILTSFKHGEIPDIPEIPDIIAMTPKSKMMRGNVTIVTACYIFVSENTRWKRYNP